MKNFIKGFRFTPSNYPAEVEAKIQKYRKQGYKLPPRKVLRTPEQLEGIRESAKINTALLDYISENIREGMSTEEIDVMVYDFTTKHGAIPAPLNYEGFPKSVCTSINDVVCHGIPSKTEILQSGDIINVDVSTIYKGYFSDASRMFMIGDVSPEMRKLVQVTKECMEIGIAAAQPWKQLGDVGAAIQEHAEKNGFNVVRDLCGHGVGMQFHEAPDVEHFGRRGTGMMIVPGMTFTIEPMINMGTYEVFVDEADGWTVCTDDGLPSAQWEELILLIVIAALAVISIVLSLAKGNNHAQAEQLQAALRQQMQENREELNRSIRELRMEMTQTLNQNMQQLQDVLHKNMMTNGELQRQKFDTMARQQEVLIKSTEKRLDDMRLMVEEKLQKTLNERIGQSFEIVRSQLENVQKGLGEMKSLAQDVGGLKKVLSNVKMRGTFGEVQLGALLEQMMSPEQYDANVKTKKSGTEFVEFAIKLPGKDDANSTVYLPIDAKFPKDVYEQYYDAFEAGDTALMESSGKQLETTIKKMAKDIHDKYVDPPFTTDFAIMFLPFESIYAEVIRRTSLVETLQKEYKIVVTGPTTLGAILNSLQMGFRTLAIQKRTGEVWTVLGAVKTEFSKFGGLLEKVQKNLQSAGDQLEEVMGKRTRAIERKLRQVEQLPHEESQRILPIADDGDDE